MYSITELNSSNRKKQTNITAQTGQRGVFIHSLQQQKTSADLKVVEVTENPLKHRNNVH